jgi:uncharacterized protein (UPF0248 family)
MRGSTRWCVGPGRAGTRIADLYTDIQRKLPAIIARIWPARFVESSSEASGGELGDYQGYYLIGLEWDDADGQPRTRQDTKVMQGTLQSILQRFVEQIQSDEKYFNPSSSWVSASVVNGSELEALKVDSRDWGEYTLGGSDSELDEVEDEDEEELLMEENDVALTSQVGSTSGRAARLAYVGSSAKSEGGAKLRTALDVINRLRWDTGLDSGDYIVGYDDRFLGAKEKPLDLWKSEQTDEEFIPQHRILYFKRKSDGEVIWDRRTRKDIVFGSGEHVP